MGPSGSVVSIPRLVEQLLELGVRPGGVLLVHTSFRAVRPVEGGPLGLISALVEALGPEGTLVMPSWPSDADEIFDAAQTPSASDLGIVAQEFWRLPGVGRTSHVQAFAARGPAAEFLLADPLPLPPHIPASPVGRVHERSGQVLLLGVHHDANTTIHLAEVMAGVRYGRKKSCLGDIDGEYRRIDYIENDHCCEHFRLVGDWLRDAGVEREGTIGHAESRLASASDIVDAVVSRLSRDPFLFLHRPDERCRQCDEARATAMEAEPDVS